MIRLELRPAIRLAFLLIPTAWMYIPMAVFFSTTEATAIHTAAMMMGVGMGPT